VGRIRDFHKRFSDLIKAVAILKEKGLINIKLVIVGDGADRPILEELSKTLGVAGNVIFTGFKPDTAIYYCIMNVFAIASHMEAFGLVAAEAMYFKLPVVATMVGGLKDIVEEGTTGILVNKVSPAELAAAFEQLYHNRQLITMYGLAGHARAVEEYSAEKYVNNVTALYNSFNRESD
jgi:glycosyltransferase involved in cell wall biosynthesis